MEYSQGSIRLSATDVANHLSCKHLSTLNLLLAKGSLPAPEWSNPDLKVLQQLGLDHEKAYVENLRSKALSILDVSQESNSRDATLAAMKNGVQAIVQANLASGEWLGRADVLLRIEQPSAFGDWSYEAVDCKLSRATKAETILQLCFYSELLTEAQGHEPDLFHVIRPHTGYEPESHRFSQFAAYYRYVKRAVKQAVDRADGKTYPEIVPHCDICRWWKHCDQQLRKDDSLSYVHGVSRLQRKELATHAVNTLQALATLPLPVPFRPSKGGLEGYRRIREQARIQLEARTANQPKWEKLPLEPGRGLYRLPAPSPGDLFFDFEGDPFTGESGLEYLFGVLSADDAGKLIYQSRWALDLASEKQAFEWFIDLVIERLSKFAELHIYHFGNYEPSAIKRLVLRYATKEQEVDRLLRGAVFVDLHKIFKEAILAGVEQYSLKDLEQFCGYKRSVQLADARTALHTIQHLLQLDLAASVTEKTRTVVAAYNEDDCRSTKHLRDWLEDVRKSVIDGGKAIDRPASVDGAPSDKGVAHHKRIAELFEALTRDIPVDPRGRNQSHSLEEIEVVVSMVEFLTNAGKTWTDANGKQYPLSLDRILIVAPFNDQVTRLSQRLPKAQVGTVDRFQGQEGAVVIYSMAASSAEDAPRGMEFLYNLNRFNVATSRARCACIVVASPTLFEPDCRTPKQIELANALCRYVELGKTVKG
jgi:uncharacterized protein